MWVCVKMCKGILEVVPQFCKEQSVRNCNVSFHIQVCTLIYFSTGLPHVFNMHTKKVIPKSVCPFSLQASHWYQDILFVSFW